MQVTITAVDWADPDGVKLRLQQEEELQARYGGALEPGDPPSATDVGVFLLARDRATGSPVACGALRPLGEGSAQIKRMFVLPEHRGRGLARLVLAELELQARVLGWLRLRLETGRRQPEAVALYADAGYARIQNYGPAAGAPESICFEKVLEPT